MEIMICPKCGSSVEKNDKFCKLCGEQLIKEDHNSSHDEQFDYMNYYSGREDVSSNERLKLAYIGCNQEKIEKSKFSFCFFCLGIYYSLYRKLYLFSFLYYLVILLSIFVFPTYFFIISFILNIIVCINFKKIYYSHVDKKIEAIKNRYPNQTETELINIVKKKGGTNIVVPILLTVILMVFVIIIVVVFFMVYDTSLLDDGYFDSHKKEENIGLTYQIPDYFQAGSYNGDGYYYYSYNDYDTDTSCSINVYKRENYSLYQNGEEFLRDDVRSSKNQEVSEIGTQEINQKIWYFITVEDKYSITTTYALVEGDMIYKIEYVIYEDGISYCKSNQDEFIRSLKVEDSVTAKIDA